ncbi:heparinase II/III family protein [Lysobacter olei]
MPSWERYLQIPEESLAFHDAPIAAGSLPILLVSPYALGILLGGHLPSERQLKLTDAWIATGDAEKARRLLDEGVFDFPNKGEVKVTVPMQWATAQGENNYGWQLHALGFLCHLVRLHRDTGDAAALELVKAIMLDWNDKNLSLPYPSILSWNDHAAALRLGTIRHVFLHLLRSGIADVEFLKSLLSMAARHIGVLNDSSFYSKGTNHGLDQAFQLFCAAAVFPVFSTAPDAASTAMERMKHEVEIAFGPDHVHVENSPQYHPVILASVLQVNSSVTSFGGEPLIPDIPGFISGALRYLAYVLRPDGCFPPIGDSEVSPVTRNMAWMSSYSGYQGFVHASTQGREGEDFKPWHAVFEYSGYAVFRGDPSRFTHMDRPHLVLKCGLRSRYHRQDDDTSFVLHALGEDWLTDGGLYIHDHGIPEREYMRSTMAHSLVVPYGATATRQPGNGEISRITKCSLKDENAQVSCETRMFEGFTIGRTLVYNGDLQLEVADTMCADDDGLHHYQQLWQVPGDLEVALFADGFRATSPRTGNSMELRIESSALLRLGVATKATGLLGICSKKYNALEPVTVVRAEYLGQGRLDSRARLVLTRG